MKLFEGKHVIVLERDGWEFVERKRAKEFVFQKPTSRSSPPSTLRVKRFWALSRQVGQAEIAFLQSSRVGTMARRMNPEPEGPKLAPGTTRMPREARRAA